MKFHHYWKSLSPVPDVERRGCEKIQPAGGTVNGIQIDNDLTTGDRKGNFSVFMEPGKILVNTILIYNDGSVEMKIA